MVSFLNVLHVARMYSSLFLINEDPYWNYVARHFFSSYSWLWNTRVILMYYVRWTPIVSQFQCSICFLPLTRATSWTQIISYMTKTESHFNIYKGKSHQAGWRCSASGYNYWCLSHMHICPFFASCCAPSLSNTKWLSVVSFEEEKLCNALLYWLIF